MKMQKAVIFGIFRVEGVSTAHDLYVKKRIVAPNRVSVISCYDCFST